MFDDYVCDSLTLPTLTDTFIRPEMLLLAGGWRVTFRRYTDLIIPSWNDIISDTRALLIFRNVHTFSESDTALSIYSQT